MEKQDKFVPALLVVDMQEDFCAPNGSLGVEGGRELASVINELLQLPFVLKVATKDFHPQDHISFDTCHPPPNNKSFESKVMATNPQNPSEWKQLTLWPVHCVQGTPGAEIIPEIDASKFDFVVEKGRDKRTEMFSGFADMFGNRSAVASLDLAALLKERGITHVYTVGLTGDCCVKCTAVDARKEGFETFVIREGTRSVDEGESGWGAAMKGFQAADVLVVSINDKQVGRVRTFPL
ncbi:NAD(+) salvage pathway protein [Trapelia coarctata]|nr:NAD(+) salvage pathway protein [Trapelia coarctata]